MRQVLSFRFGIKLVELGMQTLPSSDLPYNRHHHMKSPYMQDGFWPRLCWANHLVIWMFSLFLCSFLATYLHGFVPRNSWVMPDSINCAWDVSFWKFEDQVCKSVNASARHSESAETWMEDEVFCEDIVKKKSQNQTLWCSLYKASEKGKAYVLVDRSWPSFHSSTELVRIHAECQRG